MSTIEEIKSLIRKLKPVLGSRVRGLWYSYLIGGEDSQNSDFLRLLTDIKAKIDFRNSIRLPPPSRSSLAGTLNMGEVIYPESEYADFGLNLSDLYKHVLICGMTGSGKTNIVLHLLTELTKKGIPFLVFDWKQDYKGLREIPGLENLEVIRIGDPECDFTFNPLIPPAGVRAKHWLGLIIDVIKHAFFVAHGPEYFFRKGVDGLYKAFGIYEGKDLYPTFADLQRTLSKEYVRGREQLWMSSSKRVLASLTFSGLLGEVLNVRTQSDLSAVFNTPRVIELDNLANLERVFLTEALLLWLYQHRKAQGTSKKLRHVTVIEEAHHVLSERREFVSGEETTIETLVRMVREFGEGVLVVDQEPSKLSRSILANTNCKICMNLGSGKDIKTVAEAMNLDREESRCIDWLNVGHAIVKMKERFIEPVHVRFPLSTALQTSQGEEESAEQLKW